MNNNIIGFRVLKRFTELGIGEKFVEENTPLDPPLLGGTFVLELPAIKEAYSIPAGKQSTELT